MGRRKPKAAAAAIGTLPDAEKALARIAELEREKARIEAGLNARIDKLKAEAEGKAKPLAEELKRLGDGLEIFARTNPALFTARRTLELAYGKLGFRKSAEIKPLPKLTWGAVLEKLKARKESAAIRVKEEVNREALQQWPEERLQAAGARRVEKDTFWYEVAAQETAKGAS